MKNIKYSIFFFLIGINFYGHDQDVHKYLTYQAWELVKYYHPEVQFSEMSVNFGHWQDGSLNGEEEWRWNALKKMDKKLRVIV